MPLQWLRARRKKDLTLWTVHVRANGPDNVDTSMFDHLLGGSELGGVIKGRGHGPTTVTVTVEVPAVSSAAAHKIVISKVRGVLGSAWSVEADPGAGLTD